VTTCHHWRALAQPYAYYRKCPQLSRAVFHSTSTHPHYDSGYSSGMLVYLCTCTGYQANRSKRLARWLDRPFFPWKRLVVGFSLAEFALENWLLFRQYRVLQRTSVPKALNKEIDTETFDKSQVQIFTSYPSHKLTGSRHTVAQRPSLASSPKSSTKSSPSLPCILTSIPSSGVSLVPLSHAMRLFASLARSPSLYCSCIC
jgi:hypothetical protein